MILQGQWRGAGGEPLFPKQFATVSEKQHKSEEKAKLAVGEGAGRG